MSGAEILALAMIVSFIALLFSGFPVAWILGGLAAVFTALAIVLEVDFQVPTHVDWFYASLSVDRIWDVMENWVLVALPMFIFMGILLDRSGIARALLTGFSRLLGGVRGGLAIAVTVIGVVLAASTGIIGAPVVLLGLLGLPVMLANGYDKHLATGTVATVGTLGILIPPSIMLVIMADRMAMSVGDLFLGALIPGVLLGMLYIAYIALVGLVKPSLAPAAEHERMDLAATWGLVKAIVPRRVADTRGARQHILRTCHAHRSGGRGRRGGAVAGPRERRDQPAGDARGDRRDLTHLGIHFRRDSGRRVLQPGPARSRRR